MTFIYIPPPKPGSTPFVSLLDLPPITWVMGLVCAWYLCGVVGAGFELANRQARWPEQSNRCYMVDLHKSSRNIQIAFGAVSLISVDHSHGWVFPFGLTCEGK